ncbi:MAG: S-adenosylmethionine:tRNA ribosyltransferase-isomerase [Chloroflexota bacterium]|nr:MAG: S-adenosylmethionine:tRNA ribosyltransferase-isomerase [Chloroflexota bacterium]
MIQDVPSPNKNRQLLRPSLDFHLPPHLEASEPAEARGLRRDGVRLMVTHYRDDRIVHTRLSRLPEYISAGDVLVVNTSGTMNAALRAGRKDGTPLELHISTRLPADLWVVELRSLSPQGTLPFYTAEVGESLSLPGGASARLLAPYPKEQRKGTAGYQSPVRLWIADLTLPTSLDKYLARHGFPIRYKYVREEWPIDYYQTVFAREMGSAEMPSAGRGFTPALLKRLKRRGVKTAPLVLHTGVASLEEHETPYEEYYRVPAETAQTVNAARHAGKRVIAVGTTVVRALETVTTEEGTVHPGEGYTKLIITPERSLLAVDGLLTGMHEPRSSHLAMLMALAGSEHLRLAYREALEKGYLWHEFGDVHLILP